MPTPKLAAMHQTCIGGMHWYVVRMPGTILGVRVIATAANIVPWDLAVPAIFVPAL